MASLANVFMNEGGSAMRENLESAFTVVGAVVGAGFASGREVYVFFSRYGANGLWGVGISVLLLMLLALRTVALARHYRSQTFADLTENHLGPKGHVVLKAIITASLWLGLGIMLSGAGAAGESLGVNKLAAIAITCGVVVYCLLHGIRSIKRVNAVLMPVLFVLVAYIFTQGISMGSHGFLLHTSSQVSALGALWSAVLYAGLNSLLLCVVIPALVHRKKAIGIIGGCMLFGVLLAATALLLLYFPILSAESPVPMLSIARSLLPTLPWVYGAILWIALTTTALADGLGLQSYVAERGWRRTMLIVCSTFPIALLPFGHLVAVVYTSLGYVALLVAAALLIPCR